MKAKFPTTSIVCVLILFTTVFTSCKKNNPNSDTTWSITQNWLTRTPYTLITTFYGDHSMTLGGPWTQSGSTITWSVGTDMTFTGTMNGTTLSNSNTMNGTLSSGIGNTGTWSGTKNSGSGGGTGKYYANWTCSGQSQCAAVMGALDGSTGPFCTQKDCENWKAKYITTCNCETTIKTQPLLGGTPPNGQCFTFP